jgi:hypothetical protein
VFDGSPLNQTEEHIKKNYIKMHQNFRVNVNE